MKKLNILLTVTAIFITTVSFCQPGTLDLSFDVDGKQTTDLHMNNSSGANATCLQTDGKIVAAGYFSSTTSLNIGITRYNTNGSLDRSFGINGVVTTLLTDGDGANGLAMQPDGKILVAGMANGKFAILRYNPNGLLDAGFGAGGLVTTADAVLAYAITTQPDGKIVAAGIASGGSGYDFAVARYSINGIPDPNFGINGIVKTDFGNEDKAYALAVQPNGQIVVAGYASTVNFVNSFAVAKYNANGSPDNNFGIQGKVSGIQNLKGDAHAVAIQSDGRILVGGTISVSPFYAAVVARFNPNGAIDNSFGSGGVAGGLFYGYGYGYGNSLAIQQDGKIVLGGVNYSPGTGGGSFAAYRFGGNGAPDYEFGTNGVAYHIFFDGARGMALQTDGKIVLAGSYHDGSNSNNYFAVGRYNSDGTADIDFGVYGMITTLVKDPNTGLDFGQSAAIQSDGKIMVAGYSVDNAVYNLSLARYTADGTADNSYQPHGFLEKGFQRQFVANAAALQLDDKILVAGKLYNGSNYDFAVLRYNANGSPDNIINSDGLITTPVGNGDDVANAVAVQQDGKMIAAGASFNGLNYDIALVRYNAGGTLDNGFGTGGKLTTNIASTNDYGYAVALQQDLKIVVAGYSYNGTDYDITVVRYLPNGNLDLSFSSDGIVTTNIGKGSSNDYARSVKIQPDGKIIVAGYTSAGLNTNYVVLRYNSNGILDNTFNTSGIVTGSFDGGSGNYCTSMALQPDGRIVLAGYFYKNATNKNDFALARYMSNGKPDGTFGTGGKVVTDFASSDDYANAVTIQQDGKIVVAGSSANDFAVARYNNSGSLLAPLTNTTAVDALKNESVTSNFSVYPNPVASTATLRFNSNQKENSILELWDASGRKIKTIFNGRAEGTQTLPFSRDGLKGGIYFLHLTTGNRQEIKKLVIE